ncbi:MAG: hypothetical protein LBP68_06460 [Acidobacteriota bacterium]|jgi:cell shape-determining protein MreD|nr:hypothetical protein [Acidobacteriota bacterium]
MNSYIGDGSKKGVRFFGLLFIAFLVLKLCKVIAWSWWWVTAPLWMPSLVVMIIFVFAIAMHVIIGGRK